MFKPTLSKFVVMLVITVFTLGFSVVRAEFTPAPTADFYPIFGNSSSTNFIDVSFSISANGHPGLVGKPLQVVAVVCNGSGLYSFYDCEIDDPSITTVTLDDVSSYKSVTFSNLALYYLNSNYIMCYVYDPSTANGDFCGGSTYAGDPDYKEYNYTGGLLPVYRFWSDTKQHHFFTISHSEKSSVEDNYSDSIWKYEKPAFFAYRNEVCNGAPVYRFWSDTKQTHFYTISWSERQYIIANYPQNIWKYEGIAYCAHNTAATSAPVYRFWSDTKQGHFYTVSESEKNHIIATYPTKTWKYEGIAFWAYR